MITGKNQGMFIGPPIAVLLRLMPDEKEINIPAPAEQVDAALVVAAIPGQCVEAGVAAEVMESQFPFEDVVVELADVPQRRQ